MDSIIFFYRLKDKMLKLDKTIKMCVLTLGGEVLLK